MFLKNAWHDQLMKSMQLQSAPFNCYPNANLDNIVTREGSNYSGTTISSTINWSALDAL